MLTKETYNILIAMMNCRTIIAGSIIKEVVDANDAVLGPLSVVIKLFAKC